MRTPGPLQPMVPRAPARRAGVLRYLCGASALAALAACTALPPVDPEVAAQRCEIRAQQAQGPTGSVTVGTNNRSGGFGEFAIGLSSDFLRGADPQAVYESCVRRATGAAPIRPPVLR